MKYKKLLIMGICLATLTSLSGCSCSQPKEVADTEIKTAQVETTESEETEEETEIETETEVEVETEEEETEAPSDFIIEPCDDTPMYCSSTGGVNVRALPTANSDKLGFLNQNEKVTMNGLVTSYQGQECSWYQIKFGDNSDSVAYVNASYLGERPVETSASASSSSSASSQQSQATAPAQAQPEAASITPPAAPSAPVSAAQAEIDAMWSGEVFTPDASLDAGYVDFN